MAAVVLGVLALGLGAGSVLLDHLTHTAGTGGPVADAFVTAAGVVPATAVGALLAARRPRNPIGWLLLAIVIVEISPASQYLILDYRMHHGSLPLGWVAVVLEECWPMFLVSVTLLLWLFPDGTLPAGRWHRAAAFGAVGWLLVGLATSSRGVLVAAGHDVRIQASGSLANPSPGAFRVLDVVVIAGTLVSWVVWLAVQIPTYRRASGVYRQQLKWLYGGAAIFVFAYFGVFLVTLAVKATSRRYWPARPFQRTLSPDRQTAAIRAVIGACRCVLRWLALRGAPPGNRGLPVVVPLSHVVRPPPRRRADAAPTVSPGRTTSDFVRRLRKTGRPRSLPPDDNSRRFKPAAPQRRCAPARGSASRTLRSI